MERSSDAPSSPSGAASVASAIRGAPPVSAGVLAFAALGKHRERILANEPGTRLGEDPEALHDMRVATRRLRAVLALFADALPKRGARIRRELRWLGRMLGEVRDLDVQIERLGLEAGDDPALVPAAAAVSAVLVRRRDGARRRMLRALDSRRTVRLLERLAAFVEAGPSPRGGLGRQPAAVVAPDLLGRAYRKVRRAGDRLSVEASPEEFHRMRIRCKRLRYALELHEPLYGKPAEAIVARLVALQDHLGLHQDCHVLLGLIDQVRSESGKRLPPGALFAMGKLAERVARRAATLRRQFPRLFRAVRGKAWKRVKHAFDARLADTVHPRRRRPARTPEPKPEPRPQSEPTGDSPWTPTRPAPSHSTAQPPSSTAS